MNQSQAIGTSQVDCPQCGAPIEVPHDAACVRCASCGSTLAVASGVRTNFLREKPGTTPEQAAGLLSSWIHRQGYVAEGEPTVGSLRFFPFLHLKAAEEQIIPLKGLPSPAVGFLAESAAEFQPTGDQLAEVDARLLQAALETARDMEGLRVFQVELRAYYPVRYQVERNEGTFTAVVGAGQGGVYPDKLPARAAVSQNRLRLYLLGLGAALVIEALAIPNAFYAVAAIVVTAAAFCAWMVRRPDNG